MNRIPLIIVLLGLVGCKKDSGENRTFIPPLSTCTYTAYTHSGAITNDNQDVVVNTDVLNHPKDQLSILICTDPACTTTGPSVYYTFGSHIVRFLNAFSAGFTHYEISEAVCSE